ncbi:MAG: hypothetical protein ACKVOT_17275 [Polaromonas sp.]
MDDDIRCCGTGTCLINAEGFCWCGQQWDGSKMCFAAQQVVVHVAASERLHGAPSDAMPLAEKPER